MTKSSSFPGTNAQKSSAPWMKSFFLSLKALVPYRYISVSQVTVHKRFIMIKTKPVAFQNITMKINRYGWRIVPYRDYGMSFMLHREMAVKELLTGAYGLRN